MTITLKLKGDAATIGAFIGRGLSEANRMAEKPITTRQLKGRISSAFKNGGKLQIPPIKQRYSPKRQASRPS